MTFSQVEDLELWIQNLGILKLLRFYWSTLYESSQDVWSHVL